MGLCMRLVLSFFFRSFFFQAEDGIRDHCVTGVQTCALPIWWRHAVLLDAVKAAAVDLPGLAGHARLLCGRVLRLEQVVIQGNVVKGRANPGDGRGHMQPAYRSEERRVGKEWRARWSRWHETK